jgi:enoyl-CoA hydratase/carnithine racemase
MSDDVRIEISDRVMEITFDRVAKKNALTQAMYGAAAAGFAQADDDDGIRCVLITGGDEVFTAGNDVGDFTAAPAETSDRQSGDLMGAILDFPKPVVAAVSGYAVGIGTTMLLHMDLVYADETAIFRTPFVDLGLTPEFASTQTLPRLAGYQRAAEMLLLNAKIDAQAALKMGLVNAVLPAGQCLAHARGVARALAAKPPAALRETKALMRAMPESDAERMARENKVFEVRLQSPELKEAVAAFQEKRAPDFSRF